MVDNTPNVLREQGTLDNASPYHLIRRMLGGHDIEPQKDGQIDPPHSETPCIGPQNTGTCKMTQVVGVDSSCRSQLHKMYWTNRTQKLYRTPNRWTNRSPTQNAPCLLGDHLEFLHEGECGESATITSMASTGERNAIGLNRFVACCACTQLTQSESEPSAQKTCR